MENEYIVYSESATSPCFYEKKFVAICRTLEEARWLVEGLNRWATNNQIHSNIQNYKQGQFLVDPFVQQRHYPQSEKGIHFNYHFVPVFKGL